MNAIETLISVLCDPEGKCCISGSDDDRRLIDSALAELAQAAQPAPEQADSVTAPAGGAVAGPGGKCMGPRCMASTENGYAHSRECIDEAGEVQGWKPTAGDYATCGPSAPTPPAQAADSVLEDAARYRTFIDCGQPIYFMGEEYCGKAALDAAVDKARKQGEKQ